MDPLETRRLAVTEVEVTRLGFGGGTLGDPTEVIDEARADLTVETAYTAGIGHFDTSPWYGKVLHVSEHPRTSRTQGFTMVLCVSVLARLPVIPYIFAVRLPYDGRSIAERRAKYLR